MLLFTPAMKCAAQDKEHECVDNTSWQITANGGFSGTWIFHRDGEVVGILPTGGVAWKGRGHEIGHHRYVFELDYQGGHTVQYVQFTDGCERLMGYSDPEMHNLNREGTRSR